MSSFANFFRTLPETLQQPAALAMLGSVGAHLLVFATLPAFTSSNEPPSEAEVRRVRILEAPQNATSQPSASQLTLPPVPNTPNSKTRLPVTAGGKSPIPNPLYTIPDLDSPLTLNPPIPVPSQPQVSQADRFNELLRRLAARQPQTSPPSKPPANSPTTQSSPQPNISISSSSSLPGLTPANPSDVAKGVPSPTATQSPAPTTQPPATSAPLPSATSTPLPPVSSTPLPPVSSATQTPAPTATQSPAPTPNDRLLIATRYSPEGTSQQDGIQAAQKLTEELKAKGIPWEYVRLRQAQEPIKEVDYPLAFPLNNYKQHPAVVALFIGKDGKPINDRKPRILNSTGYPILNDKAIEYVQKDANQPNRFPAIAEDKIRVFVYEFQFKAPSGGTTATTSPRG